MYAKQPKEKRSQAEKTMAQAVARRRQALAALRSAGVEIVSPHEAAMRWANELKEKQRFEVWLYGDGKVN